MGKTTPEGRYPKTKKKGAGGKETMGRWKMKQRKKQC